MLGPSNDSGVVILDIDFVEVLMDHEPRVGLAMVRSTR